MKKNYLFKTLLFSIPLTAFVLVSFSGGVGGARTGSPGDGGTTCTVCHAPGANFNASAMITTNIPAVGYDVNTDYTVTVTASSTAPGHGFLLTAEKLSDNGKIGQFLTGGSTDVSVQDSGSRISHSNSSNNSWTVTWRSPSTLQGPIQFYAAVASVNNNGTNGGDQVVTTTSGQQNALSIPDFKRLDFEMYPNPATSIVNVQLPSGISDAQVSVFNLAGRQIKTQNISSSNKELDIQDLASGMYMLRVETDSKIGVQQFVKE